MLSLLGRGVPCPVYSITDCIIEPHASYIVLSVGEYYVPQVAQVTLKYLSATGLPMQYCNHSVHSGILLLKSVVRNIKKGTRRSHVFASRTVLLWSWAPCSTLASHRPLFKNCFEFGLLTLISNCNYWVPSRWYDSPLCFIPSETPCW